MAEHKVSQLEAIKLLFALARHEHTSPNEAFSWKGRTLRNRKARLVVTHDVLRSFMFSGAPSMLPGEGEHVLIHAFTGSGDVSRLTHESFNVTNVVKAYDTRWQAAFQGVPLSDTEIDWEIAEITSGVTFDEIPEGSSARMYKYGGTTKTIKTAKYAAQIGETIELVRGNRLSRFANVVQMARDALFTLWADTHYDLLKVAGPASDDIDWVGVTADTQVSRDARTINLARTTITKDCKDLFADDTATAPVLLYAPPDLEDRIMRAMSPGDSAQVERGRRTTLLLTWNDAIDSDDGLMVLPGRKIQNATVASEISFDRQDQDSLSRIRTYWTWFGATVGEVKQVRTVNFS